MSKIDINKLPHLQPNEIDLELDTIHKLCTSIKSLKLDIRKLSNFREKLNKSEIVHLVLDEDSSTILKLDKISLHAIDDNLENSIEDLRAKRTNLLNELSTIL